jgi:hypothetical protein
MLEQIEALKVEIEARKQTEGELKKEISKLKRQALEAQGSRDEGGFSPLQYQMNMTSQTQKIMKLQAELNETNDRLTVRSSCTRQTLNSL